jgi:hypothetical protein
MAIVIVHDHGFSFEITESVDSFAGDEIIFPPGIVALGDVNVRIPVEGGRAYRLW